MVEGADGGDGARFGRSAGAGLGMGLGVGMSMRRQRVLEVGAGEECRCCLNSYSGGRV